MDDEILVLVILLVMLLRTIHYNILYTCTEKSGINSIPNLGCHLLNIKIKLLKNIGTASGSFAGSIHTQILLIPKLLSFTGINCAFAP